MSERARPSGPTSAPRSRPSPRRPTTAFGVSTRASPVARVSKTRCVRVDTRARPRRPPFPRVSSRRCYRAKKRSVRRAAGADVPDPHRRPAGGARRARGARVSPLGAPRHAPPLARRAQGAAGRPRATRLPLVVRVRLDSPGSSFGPRTGPGPGNRLGRADTRRGRERRRRARGRGPGRLPRCRPRRRPLRRAGPDPPRLFRRRRRRLVDDVLRARVRARPRDEPRHAHRHRIIPISRRVDSISRARTSGGGVRAASRGVHRGIRVVARTLPSDDDGRRRRRRARRWASPHRRRRRREGRGGTTPRRRFRGHARRGGGEREARGGGGDASRRERDARRRTRTRGGGRRARDDTRAREIGRRWESDDGNRIKTEVRFERRGGGGGRGRGRVVSRRHHRDVSRHHNH